MTPYGITIGCKCVVFRDRVNHIILFYSAELMGPEGLVFRSYLPQDPSLRRYCAEKVSVDTLEDAIKEEIAQALIEAEQQVGTLPCIQCLV